MPAEAKAIAEIVDAQLSEIDDVSIRSGLEAITMRPRQESRIKSWDPSAGSFLCWIVADFGDGVGIAYCENSPVLDESPWGLVFLAGDDLGGPNNWYWSLEGLYRDSGYMEQSPPET